MSPVELTASQRPPTMACSRSPPAMGAPPKAWGVLRCLAMMVLSSLSEIVNSGVTSVRGTGPPAVTKTGAETRRSSKPGAWSGSYLACINEARKESPLRRSRHATGNVQDVTHRHRRFRGADGALSER